MSRWHNLCRPVGRYHTEGLDPAEDMTERSEGILMYQNSEGTESNLLGGLDADR